MSLESICIRLLRVSGYYSSAGSIRFREVGFQIPRLPVFNIRQQYMASTNGSLLTKTYSSR